MKFTAILLFILSAWPECSFSQSWITERCKLAISLQKIDSCNRTQLLWLIEGINGEETSSEQQGCVATSVESEHSEYKPPIPLHLLSSIDEVMISDTCNHNSIINLLFGNKIQQIGHLPLLIAVINLANQSRPSRIFIVHDKTDSYIRIKKFGALYGVDVSM